MGIAYNTSIVTDGLVLCLDAANVKSYPGTGNLVVDLSKFATAGGTFYDVPVLTERSFDFTGSNIDGISITGANYSGLVNFTIESLFKINSTHQNYDGALISSGNWNSSHWALSIIQNNSGVRTRGPELTWNYTFTLGNWYHVAYRRNGTTMSCFINGIKQTDQTSSTNNPLTSDATNTSVGRETYANGYFNLNGKIATTRIYNRALADNEIQQNFNALRGRYGI